MKNLVPTIGIEVHVELKTKSKLFSSSKNSYGELANTNTNVIDLGYPGTLPTLNKEAINLAIKATKVLNAKINKVMHFDRKNYFYPDNPKNFQITQNRTPIGYDGYVEIEVDGVKKKILIEELHIEEDTCKSIHTNNSSLLDFNRAGVPLIEIVTKPVIESSKEAVLYLEKLRELLFYSGVSDCKIEEGSMRCDANVSLREEDSSIFGTKVEIKNIGSITNVGLAIEEEIRRQKELLLNGEKVVEETRRYDDKENKTISMRVKETGNDYRYFPEPDIPLVHLTDEYIEEVVSTIPVLPDVRRDRYIQGGVSPINANKVIQNKDLSDYLEEFSSINLVTATNLLLGDIQAYLNKNNVRIFDTKLTPSKFMELVDKIDKKEITSKIFKELINDILETDLSISELLEKNGIKVMNNKEELIKIINSVLESNQESVNDYKNGNERVIKYLIGQVMKESKGTADPVLVNELLSDILKM